MNFEHFMLIQSLAAKMHQTNLSRFLAMIVAIGMEFEVKTNYAELTAGDIENMIESPGSGKAILHTVTTKCMCGKCEYPTKDLLL